MNSLSRSANPAPGIFWAAVSVLCWGTLFPAVSFLLKRGNVDCYTMAQSRFLAAGILMLAVIALQTRRAPWENLHPADFFHLIIQSVFAAAMSGLLFFGQSFGIPVVNASMLEAEAPILIFLLSIVILREKPSLLQTLGLLLGFAGSMLVLKAVNARGIAITSISSGDAMVFAGAVSWALYTVLARNTIRKIGGLRYTAWSLLFAGIWILLFQLAAKLPLRYPVEIPDLAATLYLGLVPTALAFFAWNNAQHYISAGLLGISGYFTPMLTALLGWLCFGEKVTFFQISGMFLVVGAALIEPEIAQLLRRKK